MKIAGRARGGSCRRKDFGVVPDGAIRRAFRPLLCAGLLPLTFGCSDSASDTPSRRESGTVILAINDVYRIEGIGDGASGGIARLRTLRAALEKTHPDLLVLHAGDVIAPSFMGRRYQGAQMISTLNLLDGRDGFDHRLFVAFGNHEFDESRCDRPQVLRSRVSESDFNWLSSNIGFDDCRGHGPMLSPDAPLLRRAIVPAGGLRVGLFALIHPFPPDRQATRPDVRPFLDTARSETRRLRAGGADAVIAITHLDIADDLRILRDLGDDAPDLIVGGHDHYRMRVPEVNPRIFKADADAVTASVITLRRLADGRLDIAHRFEWLDDRITAEPAVQAHVEQWRHRHAAEYCARAGESADCLDQVIGRTSTPIDAEELKNRGQETGFGNWIADHMLAARPDADVAIVNSGTLRLNYELPAGTVVRRRHLEEIFGFVNPLLVVETSGDALWAAMQNSLAQRGDGGWAHFAGLAVRVARDETGASRLTDIAVRRRDGRVEALTPNSTGRYRVVTGSFLACGGDRYDFGIDLAPFGGDGEKCRAGIKDVIDPAGPPIELNALIRRTIADEYAGGRAIAPHKDGRLCEAEMADCLIARWQGQKAR